MIHIGHCNGVSVRVLADVFDLSPARVSEIARVCREKYGEDRSIDWDV